jgi:hypothetical protein
VAKAAQSTAEADLAYLRAIVDGGPGGHMTMGVCYFASGLLYGVQCLFHIGQIHGWVRWPDLATLAFVVAVTVAVIGVLIWASLEDRKHPRGPAATRAMNAAFSGTGLANVAVILIFAIGSNRDQDFGVWLYYPAVVFAFQAGAWMVAWTFKRKGWMAFCAGGAWIAAVALGLTVRQPTLYLYVCTAALFGLFALPGWIMIRDARRAPVAA